jgi:hypothetical protein
LWIKENQYFVKTASINECKKTQILPQKPGKNKKPRDLWGFGGAQWQKKAGKSLWLFIRSEGWDDQRKTAIFPLWLRVDMPLLASSK